MKAIVLVMASLLVVAGGVGSALAQEISISIDRIVANEVISGYVRGLRSADYPKYKVIVYVHTDSWYIHPYAGQGEGLSWASIREDGTWRIQTVQRQFKADRVAALIVRRNYPEPGKVQNLDMIQHRAIVVRKLVGMPDYGKL